MHIIQIIPLLWSWLHSNKYTVHHHLEGEEAHSYMTSFLNSPFLRVATWIEETTVLKRLLQHQTEVKNLLIPILNKRERHKNFKKLTRQGCNILNKVYVTPITCSNLSRCLYDAPKIAQSTWGRKPNICKMLYQMGSLTLC